MCPERRHGGAANCTPNPATNADAAVATNAFAAADASAGGPPVVRGLQPGPRRTEQHLTPAGTWGGPKPGGPWGKGAGQRRVPRHRCGAVGRMVRTASLLDGVGCRRESCMRTRFKLARGKGEGQLAATGGDGRQRAAKGGEGRRRAVTGGDGRRRAATGGDGRRRAAKVKRRRAYEQERPTPRTHAPAHTPRDTRTPRKTGAHKHGGATPAAPCRAAAVAAQGGPPAGPGPARAPGRSAGSTAHCHPARTTAPRCP
jgi:hypothetical protein